MDTSQLVEPNFHFRHIIRLANVRQVMALDYACFALSVVQFTLRESRASRRKRPLKVAMCHSLMALSGGVF